MAKRKTSVSVKLDQEMREYFAGLPDKIRRKLFRQRRGEVFIGFEILCHMQVGKCRCPILKRPVTKLSAYGIKRNDPERNTISNGLEAIVERAKTSLVRSDCAHHDANRRAFIEMAIRNKEVFAASCANCRERQPGRFPLDTLGAPTTDGTYECDGPGKARMRSCWRNQTFNR